MDTWLPGSHSGHKFLASWPSGLKGTKYRVLAPRSPDLRVVELIHDRGAAGAAHQFVAPSVAQPRGGFFVYHKILCWVEAGDVELRFQLRFGDESLHLPDGFAPAGPFWNLLGDQLGLHDGVGGSVHVHVESEVDEVVVVHCHRVVAHVRAVEGRVCVGHVVGGGGGDGLHGHHAGHGDGHADEAVRLELEVDGVVVVAHSGRLAGHQSDFGADLSGTLPQTHSSRQLSAA